MANENIENLNFAVLLNTNDFDQKIQKVEETAKRFNTSLSEVLNIKSKVQTTEIFKKTDVDRANEIKDAIVAAAQSIGNISLSSLIGGLSDARDKTEAIVDQTGKIPNNIKKSESAMTGLKSRTTEAMAVMGELRGLTGLTFGIVGVRQFLSSMIDITGQLEMQRVAMGHILGDMQKGEHIFSQLRDLSIPSYFNLPELAKYAKQLTALAIPYEELFETTRKLADVSAGVGVSFERIALAYGHIRSMGFLRGMQARQLTNAGIPIFEELAKNLTAVEGKLVSISEVYDRMSKRQITFNQVKEVFTQMTSEGGKFYNMQIALTDTLAGRINKLKGVWQVALSDVGNTNSGILKGTVNVLIWLAQSLTKIGSALGPIIYGFGAFGAVLASLALKNFIVKVSQLTSSFFRLGFSEKMAAEAATLFGNSAKAAAVGAGAITAAVVAVVSIVTTLIGKEDELTQKLKEGLKTVEDEKKNLKELFDILKDEKASREDKAEAIQEVNSKYKQYLDNIITEKTSVEELSDAYDKLTVAIKGKTMAAIEAAYQEKVQGELNEARADLTKTAMKVLAKYGLSGRKIGKFISKTEGLESTAPTIERFIGDYISTLRETFPELSRSQISRIMKELTGGKLLAWEEVDMGVLGNVVQKVRLGVGDWFNENEIGNLYEAAQNVKLVEDAFRELKAGYNEGGESAGDVLVDFQEKVDKALSKSGKYKNTTEQNLKNLFGYGDTKDWQEYRKAIAKKVDELNQDLEGEYREDQRKRLQDEIRFAKDLDAVFGGRLLNGSKSYKKEESQAEKDQKERIEGWKKEIDILRKYMTVYQSFQALVDDESAQKLTNQAFGGIPGFNNITNFDFLSQIEELINKLRAEGEKGQQAADSIMASLGLGEGRDLQQKLKTAQRLTNTYRNMIQSLSAEDTAIDGKGFWYKINKITSDLSTKLNKIDILADKAKRGLMGIDSSDPNAKSTVIKMFTEEGMSEEEANAWWDKWVSGGEAAIRSLVGTMKANAQSAAAENARNLAQTFVKEAMEANAISIENLGSLSAKQLRLLKSQIEGLMDSIKLNDVALGLFGDGNTIGDLTNVDLDSLWGEGGPMAGMIDEDTKKLLKLIQALQKAGASFGDFSKEATSALAKVGKKIGLEISDKTAKTISHVIKSLNGVSSALAELGANSGNDALADIAGAFSEIGGMTANIVEGFSKGTWEGISTTIGSVATSFINMFTESARLKNAIREAAEEARLLNAEMRLAQGKDTIFGTNEIKAAQNAFKEIEDITAKVGKNLDAVNGRKTFRWKKGLFNIGRESKTIKAALEELGYDLLDEYGNLNEKGLQAILDTYDKLTSSSKRWIKAAINDSKIYREAMEQVNDVLEGLYGDIADSAADKIIERWRQMRDAAADYNDILDSVAAAYAKIALKETIIDTVFTPELKKQLSGMLKSKDYFGAMTILDNAMQSVEAMTPQLTQLMEVFDKWMKPGGGDANASGLGLQSMTEDTASLIASYINAMRADLAYLRSLQSTGFADVKAIRSLLETRATPNYNEYLTKIELHTAEIEKTNAAILSELRSIIINNGSGMGVRAYI